MRSARSRRRRGELLDPDEDALARGEDGHATLTADDLGFTVSRMVACATIRQQTRLLSLTAAGKRLATNVERSSRDRFRRLMSAVPREARAGVLSSLACLNQALASVDPPGESRHTRKQSAENSGDHG